MRSVKPQAGVMLIEALIGILIFSIGILALIGMQGAAMRNTTDAKYRSEAAFLATEIVGRIWVDIANIAKYDNDYTTAYAFRDEWRTKVATLLPGVDLAGATRPSIEHAVVVVSGTNTNEVTVVIQWQQPGETAIRKLTMVNRINGAT
jgi:type IV pilus assembly protein PilV